MEMLFKDGARDVFTVPVTMKKSRPGILLCVICDKSKEEDIVRSIFKYTSTIGIREVPVKRFTLNRRIISRNTKFGDVRVKISEGFGITREKIEYDDLSAIASREGKSISEISDQILEV
ncbi:MAG: LarC family nickel insertion protein, partial [Clostridiales bacterium]|nr:LarC family nickel insertion protein [Clostridiales bacterium]